MIRYFCCLGYEIVWSAIAPTLSAVSWLKVSAGSFSVCAVLLLALIRLGRQSLRLIYAEKAHAELLEVRGLGNIQHVHDFNFKLDLDLGR